MRGYYFVRTDDKKKWKNALSLNYALAYFQRLPLAKIWSRCRGRIEVIWSNKKKSEGIFLGGQL